MPGRVCPLCQGRGVTFGGRTPRACPRCSGDARTGARKQSRLITLSDMAQAHRDGSASDRAFHSAVRQAAEAGATMDDIRRVTRLSVQQVRDILYNERGQEQLW